MDGHDVSIGLAAVAYPDDGSRLVSGCHRGLRTRHRADYGDDLINSAVFVANILSALFFVAGIAKSSPNQSVDPNHRK